MQLNLHCCQQLGKWDEIPYIKIFILLHNEVSPATGNSLMMQRRKLASKPRPDSKTKEKCTQKTLLRNSPKKGTVTGDRSDLRSTNPKSCKI